MMDNKYDHLGLTPEQLKVAKSVYRAMRRAAKLNVFFWDNYGSLTAFNGDNFKGLLMNPSESYGAGNPISINQHPEIVYFENIPNLFYSTSDDEVWLDQK